MQVVPDGSARSGIGFTDWKCDQISWSQTARKIFPQENNFEGNLFASNQSIPGWPMGWSKKYLCTERPEIRISKDLPQDTYVWITTEDPRKVVYLGSVHANVDIAEKIGAGAGFNSSHEIGPGNGTFQFELVIPMVTKRLDIDDEKLNNLGDDEFVCWQVLLGARIKGTMRAVGGAVDKKTASANVQVPGVAALVAEGAAPGLPVPLHAEVGARIEGQRQGPIKWQLEMRSAGGGWFWTNQMDKLDMSIIQQKFEEQCGKPAISKSPDKWQILRVNVAGRGDALEQYRRKTELIQTLENLYAKDLDRKQMSGFVSGASIEELANVLKEHNMAKCNAKNTLVALKDSSSAVQLRNAIGDFERYTVEYGDSMLIQQAKNRLYYVEGRDELISQRNFARQELDNAQTSVMKQRAQQENDESRMLERLKVEKNLAQQELDNANIAFKNKVSDQKASMLEPFEREVKRAQNELDEARTAYANIVSQKEAEKKAKYLAGLQELEGRKNRAQQRLDSAKAALENKLSDQQAVQKANSDKLYASMHKQMEDQQTRAQQELQEHREALHQLSKNRSACTICLKYKVREPKKEVPSPPPITHSPRTSIDPAPAANIVRSTSLSVRARASIEPAPAANIVRSTSLYVPPRPEPLLVHVVPTAIPVTVASPVVPSTASPALPSTVEHPSENISEADCSIAIRRVQFYDSQGNEIKVLRAIAHDSDDICEETICEETIEASSSFFSVLSCFEAPMVRVPALNNPRSVLRTEGYYHSSSGEGWLQFDLHAPNNVASCKIEFAQRPSPSVDWTLEGRGQHFKDALQWLHLTRWTEQPADHRRPTQWHQFDTPLELLHGDPEVTMLEHKVTEAVSKCKEAAADMKAFCEKPFESVQRSPSDVEELAYFQEQVTEAQRILTNAESAAFSHHEQGFQQVRDVASDTDLDWHRALIEGKQKAHAAAKQRFEDEMNLLQTAPHQNSESDTAELAWCTERIRKAQLNLDKAEKTFNKCHEKFMTTQMSTTPQIVQTNSGTSELALRYNDLQRAKQKLDAKDAELSALENWWNQEYVKLVLNVNARLLQSGGKAVLEMAGDSSAPNDDWWSSAMSRGIADDTLHRSPTASSSGGEILQHTPL
jgi:hypothetical protein